LVYNLRVKMSYINFNRDVAFKSTSGQVDAFNRLKVSKGYTQLDIRPIADELPEKVAKVTGGTGSGAFNSTSRTWELTVAANNDYVIYQTYERGYYQSGKDLSPIMTGHNLQPVAGVVKRFGYFNSSSVAPYSANIDGLFIETDDTKLYAKVYNNGTQTSSEDITNIIPGVTLDWSKGQILRWDFQWLGKGKVRLFLVIEESEYLIASFYHANIIANPYMLSPNHSLRFEMRSTGGAATMNIQCLAIIQNNGSDDTNNNISMRNGNTVHSFPTSGTAYVALAIRLKSDWIDMPVVFDSMDVLSTSNDNIAVEVIMNPTITTAGSALSYTGITNKPLEFAVGGNGANGHIVTPGTGNRLYSAVGLANDFVNRKVTLARRLGAHINGDRDILVVSVTPLTAGLTCFSNINFKQL
jgi:hypothetical protein